MRLPAIGSVLFLIILKDRHMQPLPIHRCKKFMYLHFYLFRWYF